MSNHKASPIPIAAYFITTCAAGVGSLHLIFRKSSRPDVSWASRVLDGSSYLCLREVVRTAFTGSTVPRVVSDPLFYPVVEAREAHAPVPAHEGGERLHVGSPGSVYDLRRKPRSLAAYRRYVVPLGR